MERKKGKRGTRRREKKGKIISMVKIHEKIFLIKKSN
jgi:hypothetical protein